jgi:hypothetical protein
MKICAPLIVGGQIVGTSECAYHAGGGTPSLSCGPSGCHDGDAPIWKHIPSKTRVTYIEPGTATEKLGEIVRCEGTCDDRVYVVRPLRTRREVELTGYQIVDANGVVWRA